MTKKKRKNEKEKQKRLTNADEKDDVWTARTRGGKKKTGTFVVVCEKGNEEEFPAEKRRRISKKHVDWPIRHQTP